MAHNRAGYLRILLNSLRAARTIESTLLIISQDVVADTAVDEAIATVHHVLPRSHDQIDFCAYMRLYSPHSIELHPKEFPGKLAMLQCNV
jgi:hypothetical protein